MRSGVPKVAIAGLTVVAAIAFIGILLFGCMYLRKRHPSRSQGTGRSGEYRNPSSNTDEHPIAPNAPQPGLNGDNRNTIGLTPEEMVHVATALRWAEESRSPVSRSLPRVQWNEQAYPGLFDRNQITRQVTPSKESIAVGGLRLEGGDEEAASFEAVACEAAFC
jgi:hypothetical protein